MEQKIKITALVHTYNAEYMLSEVLESVKDFDELLVCDMYSTDSTLEICERYGARVVFHEHTMIAEPARNFAIQSASNEWVLTVDADEVITPELREYLYEFAERHNSSDVAGLKMACLEFFMGRPLRATYPNYVTRFFKKSKTDWPPFVHTQPKIDGTTLFIPSKNRRLALQHYSNPSISYRMDKINRYTSQEVEKKMQKWKYRNWFMTSISATYKFFKNYILKGGILDGRAGYAYALLEFQYKFVVLFKIWERLGKERLDKERNSKQ